MMTAIRAPPLLTKRRRFVLWRIAPPRWRRFARRSPHKCIISGVRCGLGAVNFLASNALERHRKRAQCLVYASWGSGGKTHSSLCWNTWLS